MQIALFGHSGYDRAANADSVLLNICTIIHKKQLGLYISEELFYSFSRMMQDQVRSMCILFDVLPPVDLALSVGGDGTFLHTAASIGDTGIPILGINAGRLGFLADVNPESFEEVLDEIVSGNYRVEERTLLEITTEDVTTRLDNVHALNEVAVLKQDTSSMLAIH
ncbi:MAG: NAD(+)/NADH kinase, partial [Dysgonamonadaceae bacterium]